MSPKKTKPDPPEQAYRVTDKAIPIRIAATYAIIAAIWIFTSDTLLQFIVRDTEAFTQISIYKGWFFVFVTAIGLYLVIRRDIRVIQRSERAIIDSETKFRSLVETIDDWVWEVNEHGFYTYASPRVYDVLGYTPDEVIGKTPFDFMTNEDAETIRREFEIHAANHDPIKLLENTNVRKDGRIIVLETSGIPVFDIDGIYKGYRGIDRDITKRKRAEEALMQKDRDIRRAYVDVLDAVTGGRLIIMTPEEINESKGIPTSPVAHVSSYKEMAGIRTTLTDAFTRQFGNEDAANEFLLAANEAITNAVKHGGGGDYQVLKKDDTIQLLVIDKGPGIDFKILPKATLLPGFSTKSSLGVGFSVMLEICSRVLLSTEPGNTTVILEKRLTEDQTIDLEFNQIT